jgi:hypothetical protein
MKFDNQPDNTYGHLRAIVKSEFTPDLLEHVKQMLRAAAIDNGWYGEPEWHTVNIENPTNLEEAGGWQCIALWRRFEN